MALFQKLKKELEAYDARREQIIKASRAVLREAKTIIFLCHEGEVKKAGEALTVLMRTAAQHETTFQRSIASSKRPLALYSEGSWNAAIEELCEAWFVTNFLSSKKLVQPRGVTPTADIIVGALCDFTGEIVRLAVVAGSEKDVATIERYRNVSAEVVRQLLPMHLTGQNRQKFDAAKRNLKRIEEILYEVKVRS